MLHVLITHKQIIRQKKTGGVGYYEDGFMDTSPNSSNFVKYIQLFVNRTSVKWFKQKYLLLISPLIWVT